ncbi:hypothetical protein [Arthrobacter zhaoguopingii]|uniref:LeuD/DmdB family oxidoreductase small subunit n=1 Tax=Arthrobacter zhaoguopingii TaxID=2681491 RepID=UPI00135A1505|nr:hypothetical protein [Arthrobacter zhaoguopingii]
MSPLRLRRVTGVISTDDIIPGRYKHMYTDPADMAPHIFEHRFPGMAETFRSGDALVGDAVMGIGSSREQAVSALQAAGVTLVLAPAFGRIFFRNCWNLGVPAIELDTDDLPDGGRAVLDLERGVLKVAGRSHPFTPPPLMMRRMASRGGLLSVITNQEDFHA